MVWVCGLWLLLVVVALVVVVVSGWWLVVGGRWSVVGGRWSAVGGGWSVVGGRQSAVGGRFARAQTLASSSSADPLGVGGEVWGGDQILRETFPCLNQRGAGFLLGFNVGRKRSSHEGATRRRKEDRADRW